MRFSQIVNNLLTNAVKYTDKGSVTLTIRLAEKTEDRAKIFVSVKDTGIGIKSEDMDRLFESFERLDELKNRNIEGTGLGISIVTSLLKMMGSSLVVDSVYGEGSDFRFTLEQKIADDSPIGDFEERLKESKSHRSNEDVIQAPGAKILLVDDNGMNLKVAKNLLKLCSIVPDMASSGMEAIEYMKKYTYDIVFLDHMMPKMDGIETLHRLKEEDLIPEETTMIALTANAVVGAKELYLKEGFTDYLSKPIEIEELTEKLKAYLPERARHTKTEASYEVLEFEPAREIINTGLYDLEKLKKDGVDTRAGIRYCAGDEDLYFEMLSDYTKSYDKKSKDLNEFYEDGDLKEYAVLVHAIKSTSKTIGLNDIVESALALEQAGKAGDKQFVSENHVEFLKQYRDAVYCIRGAV